MTLRPTRAVCLPVLAVLAASGCGGGGETPLSNCALDAFTPNYAPQIAHLLVWPNFPVRVFFLQDRNYSVARQDSAIAGFNQWVAATGSKVAYLLVGSSSAADITVRFDPTTMNGVTRLTFTGLTLNSAQVELGVQALPLADVQCTAAHEFGHALGIDGHSSDAADLMALTHIIGKPCPITARDLNTLKTGYCTLFGRSRCAILPPANGPTRTITIR